MAIECHANLKEGPRVAARKACENVEVNLGGGALRLSLSKLISTKQIIELEDILNEHL